MIIRPSALRAGDKVAIVAPSRKVPQNEIESALKILETWAIVIHRGSNLYSNAHSYFSGSDEQRLSDFQEAIDDPGIKAIICARGGYGSTRFIDRVDFTPLLHRPKWIVGFSDITAVHLKLLSLSIMSIHGTMPILFQRENAAASVSSLKRLLFDGVFELTAHSNPNNRKGKAAGRTIGGNLSLLVDSIGTDSEPDTTGCILVIEEIDEYRYRLDRMMTQLRRAGKLSGLAGLIVGHMTDLKDSDLPFGESVEQIVLNAAGDTSFPIAFGFPTGHEQPNLAWVHGSNCSLDVSDEKAGLSSLSDQA